MAQDLYAFLKRDVDRISRALKYIERKNRNQDKKLRERKDPPHAATWEGILDGALAAAADIDTPETATLSVYEFNAADTNFVDTLDDVTVTNRDPLFSAEAGDYLEVAQVNTEWRPVGGGHQGDSIDGPTTRIDTPAQAVYGVLADDYYILVDTDSTGNAVQVNLAASHDGHTICVHNTGSFFFRQVTVATLQSTEMAAGNILLGPGQRRYAVYEAAPRSVWWDAGS